MQKIIITILFLITILFGRHTIADKEKDFFNTNFSDYIENLADAKDAGKIGIFIFFHLDDCPFCHKMRQTVLNKKVVIDYFNKYFLNFEENIESDVELVNFAGKTMKTKIFAQKYNRIGATPVLAFFDLKGRKVMSRTGFVGIKEFLLLAKYVNEKAYLKERFIRYKIKNINSIKI